MRRPEILVYSPGEAPLYASLIRPRTGVRIHPCRDREEAARVVGDADIIYGWKFPRDLYVEARRLRWIHAMGAGVEWALVPEVPPSVAVTRVPGVFGPWMAEYVLGWSLRITQRMATYLDAQQRRQWVSHVLPARLGGKTLTIVGLGDIGRAIARAARAVGMHVVGVSRSGRPVAGVERVHPARGLVTALAAADVGVITLPRTPETEGLIGKRELGAMRRSAWLINIGRGAVVEEDALLQALRDRVIAGAVLDVFAVEPLPSDHPLWGLDNVVVTPHISGPSIPAELAPAFNDNLARFLAGRPLRHRVDRARGY
jgi:glyoxylate/hydroxypyruvate reductase A